LQELESGRKEKYYKSMCKNLMIEDNSSSNNLNVKNAKKLTEENIFLSEKHQSSKEVNTPN